jgi:hypothetical protein
MKTIYDMGFVLWGHKNAYIWIHIVVLTFILQKLLDITLVEISGKNYLDWSQGLGTTLKRKGMSA